MHHVPKDVTVKQNCKPLIINKTTDFVITFSHAESWPVVVVGKKSRISMTFCSGVLLPPQSRFPQLSTLLCIAIGLIGVLSSEFPLFQPFKNLWKHFAPCEN